MGVKQVVSVLKDALASIENVSTSTDKGALLQDKVPPGYPLDVPHRPCMEALVLELVDLVLTLGL